MPNPYQYQGNGQGFLTDYSGLAAAGSAFQSFAGAYQDAQDRQQKRLEMSAQIEALKTKADREKFQSQMDAAKEGYMQGPNGQLQEAPLSPKVQGQNQLKAIGEGVKATAFDAYGNPTSYETDPNSPKMQDIRAKNAMASGRLDLQRGRFEETQNQNSVKAGHDIENDTVMKDLTTSRQSLARGRNLLNGSQPLTYNNLNAVQQDVINGMTKGGQSSEGKVSREMQESWTGQWNNLMAKAGQYGPNNDIRKQDPGLYKQIKSLLDDVDASVAKNQSERAQNLASSYGQTTNQKVKNVVQKKLQQYQAPAEQPQGMVPTGMLKPGMVQAPAQGQAPPPHPQDQKAIAWAHAHPKDPMAAQILKANGL